MTVRTDTAMGRRHGQLRLTEAQWQRRVVDLARYRGWLVWHDNFSRRNAAGLPDLLMVKNGRLLAVELKSESGRVRPEQRQWLTALAAVPGVTAAIWRPSDWRTVVATL